MAINPMQRKARNSFLLGALLVLIISAIIIAGLVMLLVSEKKEQQQQEALQTQVYVLNRDVASGQIITEDMLMLQTVSTLTVPANAIDDLAEFDLYSLEEKATGNTIQSDENGLYLEENNKKVRVEQVGDQYYKTVNGQRTLVEFADYPLIAKVNMAANSIVTSDLLAKSDEIANDDLRVQEYNMLILPIKLNVDDYVDVRLTLPSGQDYIVISKKRVIDVMENTVWLKLSEEETLAMSNAIVEAYQMTASKLYVNLYVEPGLQADATPTYAPSQDVINLIEKDPNIKEKARNELFARYLTEQRQNDINNALNQYAEQGLSNIEAKIQEENEKRLELKEKYLEQLNAANTGIVE